MTVESRIGAEAGVGTFTNGSGLDRSAGTLVVRDESADNRFDVTTSEGDTGVLGVLIDFITSAGSGRVLLDGLVSVEVTGSVARGDFLKASITAGKAVGTGVYGQGVFAVALAASAGGRVDAYFFGVELSSGSTPHDLWTAHDNAFRVTAGAGLSVDYQGGQAWLGGSFYSLSDGNLGSLPPNDTSYIFMNSSGVIASNITGFPGDGIPLAEADTDGTIVTAVRDRRAYHNVISPSTSYLFYIPFGSDLAGFDSVVGGETGTIYSADLLVQVAA